jgi:dTDP-4-dehydrorhamnose reductase
VSWFEFAETIFNQAFEQGVLAEIPALISITTADYPTPAKRPSNSKLDTQKIISQFSLNASDWQAALNNLSKYK